MCRGDHWSPANLPQQRIFRDSFLQGKRARASNARPYKSFSTAQKNPTARKQLDIPIKRTLKSGHRLCRFCAIQQKKAAATSLPQLFGGSWWIRKPRSKKQSAGLFFAVCGRPTCSNPTSSSTKKNPQPKLRVLFGGSWWIRTTEALSSRFTVCPHWPLGKAPIFCFVSAVSPGDVYYYSKGVSKLQAFF